MRDLPLNSTWLRNRLAEIGLKQWWLAEQVGVDRRTVMRWVNGQVRTIQPGNAQLLAGVLGCRVDELLLADGAPALATPDDQRAAAAALAGTRLLDRLGPVHEWDVAEALIRASIVPGLPLDVLGSLYHQLCVACWRQDKLEEAAAHNRVALDIATRCDDHALHAQALGSRANLRFWRGEVDAAVTDWHAALALAPWLAPRDRASLHSNLGAALYETGHFDAGRAQIDAALDLLRDDGTPTQRCIARGHLGLLALEVGDAATALREARRSEALARRDGYQRGPAIAALIAADALSRSGRTGPALEHLARGRAAFAAIGVREGLNERLAARTLRHLGRLDDARAAVRLGLQWAQRFPLERADLHAEGAHVELAAGEVQAALAHAHAARALYRSCQTPLKARALAAAMSPRVTWPPEGGAAD